MNQIETLKHSLRSTVSKLLEVVFDGRYKAKLPQLEEEYIVTLDCSLSEARETIRSMGYSYQAFAARKFHHKTNKRDTGSYAKVDPNDNTKQWHIHTFSVENGVEVYSHHEYRVIHPFKHYNAIDYKQGKACEQITQLR